MQLVNVLTVTNGSRGSRIQSRDGTSEGHVIIFEVLRNNEVVMIGNHYITTRYLLILILGCSL